MSFYSFHFSFGLTLALNIAFWNVFFHFVSCKWLMNVKTRIDPIIMLFGSNFDQQTFFTWRHIHHWPKLDMKIFKLPSNYVIVFDYFYFFCFFFWFVLSVLHLTFLVNLDEKKKKKQKTKKPLCSFGLSWIVVFFLFCFGWWRNKWK